MYANFFSVLHIRHHLMKTAEVTSSVFAPIATVSGAGLLALPEAVQQALTISYPSAWKRTLIFEKKRFYQNAVAL